MLAICIKCHTYATLLGNDAMMYGSFVWSRKCAILALYLRTHDLVGGLFCGGWEKKVAQQSCSVPHSCSVWVLLMHRNLHVWHARANKRGPTHAHPGRQA